MSTTEDYFGAMFVRQFVGTLTGTTALTLWTPPAGKRIIFKGCAVRARVTTALVGATAGDSIALCENTAATPIVSLGVVRVATDVAGTDYGYVSSEHPGGYILAAGAVLRAATSATIGAGVITISGFVWGDEIQAPT